MNALRFWLLAKSLFPPSLALDMWWWSQPRMNGGENFIRKRVMLDCYLQALAAVMRRGTLDIQRVVRGADEPR